MSESHFKTIIYEVADGRARITLNRPDKRNALSEELLKELHDALWSADEDVRVQRPRAGARPQPGRRSDS